MKPQAVKPFYTPNRDLSHLLPKDVLSSELYLEMIQKMVQKFPKQSEPAKDSDGLYFFLPNQEMPKEMYTRLKEFGFKLPNSVRFDLDEG